MGAGLCWHQPLPPGHLNMKWIFRLLTLASMAAIIMLPMYMDKISVLRGFVGGGSGSSSTGGTATLSVGEPQEKEVKRQVYKWQDQYGVWQYSDVAPAEGVESNVITVSNQTNIIQSVPIVEEEPEAPDPKENISEEAKQALKESEDNDLLSFERAKNIMDEAKAVSELMQSRQQHLENISGGGG